ncbi:MAG: quinone-dependent dihydroorotate dehydrogenase, partial [Bacteriovoracaceae bacterium]
MEPENIHDLSVQLFHQKPWLSSFLPRVKGGDKYSLSDGHMSWDFPVGLAAGFDKNALALDFLSRLGFGAIEAGTVTPKPQVGNPKPRIQRIVKEESLLNSMGFPNQGQIKIMKNIQETVWARTCKLGVNLGKNKLTTDKKTPEDYAVLYEAFAPLADYLVINISSPNTPGLRALQSKEGFKAICEAVEEKRKQSYKPLYLKIAPELEESDLKDLVELTKEFGFSGIVATNTSVSHQRGKGGLSGKSISEQARLAREKVLEMTRETPSLSVIGAGGISCFQDIMDFWKKGGSFVQIYTAFIY